MHTLTKVILITVFIFICLLNLTPAQQGWFQQSIGTNFNFYSVHFIDNNTGWAVGSDASVQSAIILNTTDGGWSWMTQSSGSASVLWSVYFIDDNTGWAVGNIGAILKTTNGGDSWNPQTGGPPWSLKAIISRTPFLTSSYVSSMASLVPPSSPSLLVELLQAKEVSNTILIIRALNKFNICITLTAFLRK